MCPFSTARWGWCKVWLQPKGTRQQLNLTGWWDHEEMGRAGMSCNFVASGFPRLSGYEQSSCLLLVLTYTVKKTLFFFFFKRGPELGGHIPKSTLWKLCLGSSCAAAATPRSPARAGCDSRCPALIAERACCVLACLSLPRPASPNICLEQHAPK